MRIRFRAQAGNLRYTRRYTTKALYLGKVAEHRHFYKRTGLNSELNTIRSGVYSDYFRKDHIDHYLKQNFYDTRYDD